VEMERQRQSKDMKKMEKRASSRISMPLVLHINQQVFLFLVLMLILAFAKIYSVNKYFIQIQKFKKVILL
jgi:hypothetical protein